MIVFLDLGNIITGIRATSDGLVWTSLAPPTCFSSYIISTDEDSTLQHNATTNMVLFEELNRSGFSYCIHHTITITPVIRLTDTPLTNSQESASIVIIDPGRYTTFRDLVYYLTFFHSFSERTEYNFFC